LLHADRGRRPVPCLPCALIHFEGDALHSSGRSCRDDASARLQLFDT
jgi:hypothetical protein